MLKKVIASWNAAPGAPANWDPARDGECGALPIRVHPPQAITGAARLEWCESAWEPTPQELEWLNAGGQLVLRVIGWQVPVALYVEPPPTDDATMARSNDAPGHAAALHEVRLQMDVAEETAIMSAGRQYDTLSTLIGDVTAFLNRFGSPDRGKQTITITVTSEPGIAQ